MHHHECGVVGRELDLGRLPATEALSGTSRV